MYSRIFNRLKTGYRKLKFSGNINNFDCYTPCAEISSETVHLMARWLEVDESVLMEWLSVQNVPTQADFYVTALRLFEQHKVYFNYHIRASLEYIVALSEEGFREWLRDSFLQKLRRAKLITSQKICELCDQD